MCDRRVHGAAGGQALRNPPSPGRLGTPRSRVPERGLWAGCHAQPLPAAGRKWWVTHCLHPGTGTRAGADPPPPHPSSCTCKNQTWETARKDEVPQIREGPARRDVPAHTPARPRQGGTAARAQLDARSWERCQGSGCCVPGNGPGASPGWPCRGDRAWARAAEDAASQHHLCSALWTLPPSHHTAPPHSLLQVEGGLPVEALVLRLHVCEAREVVGVHEGEVDLRTGAGSLRGHQEPRTHGHQGGPSTLR